MQVQSHPGYDFRDMALGSQIRLTVGQLEKLLMQPGLIPSGVDSFGPVWELDVVIYFWTESHNVALAVLELSM